MSGENHFVNDGLDVIDETVPQEVQNVKKPDLSRQESVPQLFTAINSGNLDAVQNLLNHTTKHINSISYGGLTPLHAACHMQQLEILRLLIRSGAEIKSLDSLGNTALHVAVRERWSCGIEELLEHGASPDQISEPPTNVSGQLRETPLHAAVRTGNMSYVTLMLKQNPDLSVRDRNNHTIFHLAAATRNVLILKQLLKEPSSAKILETVGKGTDSLYHAALPSNAKIENEPQILKVIQVIYKCSNDNVNINNLHGETPIILACSIGLPNVVKFLVTNGADPTQIAQEKKSTLHVACISGCAETLKILIATSKVKHLIMEPDSNGCSPFYYAVEGSSVECCKTLLNNGEHLTNIGKDGISNCNLVLKKLPTAKELFRHLLDSSVKINNKSQYDPDFSITFDYSMLTTSERKDMQSSITSELTKTTLESLIKHPLLESFLYYKWSRISEVFHSNVILYLLYVILHSVFMLLTYGAQHVDWTKVPDVLMAIRLMHVILIVILVVPGFMVAFANFKMIVTLWETYTSLAAMILSACMVCMTDEKINADMIDMKSNATNINTDIDKERPINQVLASMSVLFVWVECMMLLGRAPALGTYILMFSRVSQSLIKFIFAFLSLIMAFAMCFHILFQKIKVLKKFTLSFAKTVFMMTGEIAYSEFVDNKVNMGFGLFCQIVMIFFVFMVTVIMSNLLIGLAVEDIPHLKRLGKIKRLVKKAYYLIAYQNTVSLVCSWKFIPSRLRTFLCSRCSIQSVVTLYPNQEKVKTLFSEAFPEEILKEAIRLGYCESSEDFEPNMAVDATNQLKAFQMRYSHDRRTQQHKFEELSVICGGIKKDIVQIQNKTDDQLNRIFIQQQQNHDFMNQLIQKESAM